MGKVISFVSLKGGVGKTTLSASVASELANKYNKKVLLVDANYSAPNLGLHMDIISPKNTVHDILSASNLGVQGAIHEKYNVDIIPGNFMFEREYNVLKLKQKLINCKKNYDFIVIDSSPNVNEELISAMLASDSLFIVVTPDYPSLSCGMKMARFARQRGKEASGVIINRVLDSRYQINLEEIQETLGLPVIAMINEEKKVSRSLYERKPMPIYSKRSQFSKEIERLCSSLTGLKEKRNFFSRFRQIKKQDVNREILRESFYRSMFDN